METPEQENGRLKAGLQWYANGEHFMVPDNAGYAPVFEAKITRESGS